MKLWKAPSCVVNPAAFPGIRTPRVSHVMLQVSHTSPRAGNPRHRKLPFTGKAQSNIYRHPAQAEISVFLFRTQCSSNEPFGWRLLLNGSFSVLRTGKRLSHHSHWRLGASNNMCSTIEERSTQTVCSAMDDYENCTCTTTAHKMKNLASIVTFLGPMTMLLL
jgi:hypothetical protein